VCRQEHGPLARVVTDEALRGHEAARFEEARKKRPEDDDAGVRRPERFVFEGRLPS
jgi:hypothetical protein